MNGTRSMARIPWRLCIALAVAGLLSVYRAPSEELCR